jgi:hypothetical protein
VEGTIAALGLLELRFTVKAAGVAAESVRVKFCVPTPENVMLVVDGVIVAFTVTFWLLAVYTGEDAVIIADPI